MWIFFGNVPKATIQIVIVCLILIEEGKDDGYDSEWWRVDSILYSLLLKYKGYYWQPND